MIATLARDRFVIAPDLSGFAGILEQLLARLGAESFHLYLHDFGAAAGLHLATRAPRRISSFVRCLEGLGQPCS